MIGGALARPPTAQIDSFRARTHKQRPIAVCRRVSNARRRSSPTHTAENCNRSSACAQLQLAGTAPIALAPGAKKPVTFTPTGSADLTADYSMRRCVLIPPRP
jgi:hypothetical protein